MREKLKMKRILILDWVSRALVSNFSPDFESKKVEFNKKNIEFR